jgi:hypothetical protein
LRLSRALVLLAALVVAASACGDATAGRPCWKQVQDDWSDNGTIDKTYKASCYDAAVENLPGDVRTYSDAPDVILAAKQRAVKKTLDRTPAGVDDGSSGSNSPNTSASGNDDGPAGVILNAGSSTADGMPLPLLILGGVALLLLAAGAVGVTSRRLQARRTPPPE